jgi:WhiB family redox-sensing transcriptional regulator
MPRAGELNYNQRRAVAWLLSTERTSAAPGSRTLNGLRRRGLVEWDALELTEAGRVMAQRYHDNAQGPTLAKAPWPEFAKDPSRACADVGDGWRMFFPRAGDNARDAKAVCAVCPVRVQCAAYALPLIDLHGVWGGTTHSERRAIREGRKPAPAGVAA